MLRGVVVAACLSFGSSVFLDVMNTCDVETRVRCGVTGIDQTQCEQIGCCWSPADDQPWCFDKGKTVFGHKPINVNSTFVHLFEWSWSDIAIECEKWLGPKGFTAVLISPPTDHIAGDAWWTRFQPVSYKLVSRSGGEEAFVDMVQRCKQVGVGIYADAVINHVASGTGTSIGGASYGNRATPIFSQNDMHHNENDIGSNCQFTNVLDKHNVEYCDIALLPDLCTGCNYVQETVSDYLNRMSMIGIAGVRIDAAKHQDAGELSQLLSRVNSSLWKYGEVKSGEGEAVTPSMYASILDLTEFNYAGKVSDKFANGRLRDLKGFGESWGLLPSENAVVFIDSHDTQRDDAQLTHKNGDSYLLANMFMLAHPYGYPKIMSSYRFDSHDQGPPTEAVHGPSGLNCFQGKPWVCEHRWLPIANMVGWRSFAGTHKITSFQAPTVDTIAFCRGKKACIALNRQPDKWVGTLQVSMPAGRYCDVFQSDDPSSCPTVTVDQDGFVERMSVPSYKAVAFHVGKISTVRA